MDTKIIPVERHIKLLMEKMEPAKTIKTAYLPSRKAEEILLSLKDLDINKARREGGGGRYAIWMALSHLTPSTLSITEAVEYLLSNLYDLEKHKAFLERTRGKRLIKSIEIEGRMPLHYALASSFIIPLTYYTNIAKKEDAKYLLRTLIPSLIGRKNRYILNLHHLVDEKLHTHPKEEHSTALRSAYLESGYFLWHLAFGKDKEDYIRGRAGFNSGGKELKEKLDKVVKTIMDGHYLEMGKAVKASLYFYLYYVGGLLKEAENHLCPTPKR